MIVKENMHLAFVGILRGTALRENDVTADGNQCEAAFSSSSFLGVQLVLGVQMKVRWT